MTLSLIKSPAAVSLVGNDILFKINTDNQYSAEGALAFISLIWDVGDTAGAKFNLSWGEETVEFTCADTPDDSGTQYPAYVSGSVPAWIESLEPYFQANYLLSKNFDILYNSSQNVIQIEAFNFGTEFTVTLDADTSEFEEYINHAGEDKTARDFYGIICRIWEYVIGVYNVDTLLGEDILTPDTGGNVFFKIQEYFSALFSFEFSWPEDADTRLVDRSDQVKRFYIQYAETYDVIPKKLFSTLTTPTYLIPGGIDRNKSAELNEQETNWWEQFLYKKDFLTYQPRELFVSRYQPVKLSFFVWKEHTTAIKLRVVLHFDDKTTSNMSPVSIAAVQYNLFEVTVGYHHLGLDTVEGIEYYEVYLTDQDDARISISRYFYPDLKYQENERVFIFQNSLGSPDVVRFTGITENEVGAERNDYELLNPEGFTWRDFESGNFDNTEVQRFTFNTGWLNDLAKNAKQYADYLREFYLSPKIYELVNNRLYPIKIISKKQTTGRSDEYLINIEFEAERAYSDKYYTRDENIHPSQGFEAKFEQEEFLNP